MPGFNSNYFNYFLTIIIFENNIKPDPTNSGLGNMLTILQGLTLLSTVEMVTMERIFTGVGAVILDGFLRERSQ